MDWLVAIDTLDDLVHNAPGVPLTDEVRIDRDELQRALDTLLAELPEELNGRPDVDAHLRLAEVVRNAKPVPLTGQVRVDKDAVYELLDRLRADVPPIVAGIPPLPPDLKRLVDALDALDVLVRDGRSFFRSTARIDAAELRAAMDEVHAAATVDFRRADEEGALDALDLLVAEATPARGDTVRLTAAPVTSAIGRLEGTAYRLAGQ